MLSENREKRIEQNPNPFLQINIHYLNKFHDLYIYIFLILFIEIQKLKLIKTFQY